MPLIIGALISALMQAARTYLPGIVGRLLAAFGLTLAVHEVALPALKEFVAGKLGGLPSVMVAYVDATGFGIAVTMILSCVAAARAQRAFLAKLGSN